MGLANFINHIFTYFGLETLFHTLSCIKETIKFHSYLTLIMKTHTIVVRVQLELDSRVIAMESCDRSIGFRQCFLYKDNKLTMI